MITKPDINTLREKRDIVLDRIYSHHLIPWQKSEGNVFFISDTYPGLWLEHTYDAIVWSSLNPDTDERKVSRNQVKLFIDNMKESGQLPCYIFRDYTGYAQTQECVSFNTLAYEAWEQSKDEDNLLELFYSAACRWVNWAYKYRMPHGTGLIEMFCGFDTGHDNSARTRDLTYPGEYDRASNDGSKYPINDPVLPIIAPDINAVFYGNLKACETMALKLGRTSEAIDWAKKAEEIRKKIFEICFDEEDTFFYDVDKNGNKRKIKSISITNVITEGVCDQNLVDKIFKKYLHNENEFWTPYPFPAVSISDPTWIHNLPGNSWGYYSQGLTALRSMRWMEKYGYSNEMEEVMQKWINAWCSSQTTQFGQELYPMTGEPSQCSQYYSAEMLYFLASVRRLYGI